jgi:hypothetical protein
VKTRERIPSAPDWLRTTYKVAEVVSAGNALPEMISKYAPDAGKFAGEQYPLMYQGTNRKLNGAIALQENGKLIHMIMLECVSGKSSKKSRLDGNVCERLAFRFMECMEISRLHPSATLCVLANGAFEKYRNIYHTMLQIMAERLRRIPQYDIRFVCSQKAYGVLASTLIDWLAGG